MSSELRKRKYLHTFDSFFDVNKDGCIDKQDFDIVIDKVREVRKWTSDDPEYQKVQDVWYEIFESLAEDLDVNKDGVITREEWAMANEKYANAPRPKWQLMYEDYVFEYFSPDKTGITKTNYVEVMSCYGFDENYLATLFDKMSQGKEIISEEEYRSLWREYYASDDPQALGNFICAFQP